jgi:hypothetical protein
LATLPSVVFSIVFELMKRAAASRLSARVGSLRVNDCLLIQHGQRNDGSLHKYPNTIDQILLLSRALGIVCCYFTYIAK